MDHKSGWIPYPKSQLVRQTNASGRKGRRRANGTSDQPLVTTAGAGAFPLGYLPTGLLPMGYLPTGAVETTGWGRGRSAATAVPTKARVATHSIKARSSSSNQISHRPPVGCLLEIHFDNS